ncbi:MAG: iron-sulfur cluster assembly accessory protein [Acidobacteriota bacterium]|nr:iron-sulfur cluster assembly accessory protein [Acidobacteriota bacterium]
MISLSEKAIDKVKSFMASQEGACLGLRVSVVGGGCSGFQYEMNLAKERQESDQVIDIDGFQLFIDSESLSALDGTEIDYVESIEGAGFKFKNPNVTATCGCGESFQV